MTRVFGIFLMTMAFAVAVVPLNTACPPSPPGIPPMECHWTSRAGIAVGIPLAVLGGLLFLSRRQETLRALGSLGTVLGVIAALLPTVLFSVCTHPDAPCNAVMKPTLILAGILIALASLVVTGLAGSADRQET